MITPGIYPDISNDTYHASNEWLSSSQLKVALQSPMHYKYFVLDKKGKKEATKSKDFGSACHKLILEPDTFMDEYAIIDTNLLDMRRTQDRAVMERFKQDNAGKIVLSQEDFDRAVACRDSVMAHKDARRLLEEPGQAEVSIYAEYDHVMPDGEVVRFKLRVRPDKLTASNIIDLKTTKNPAKDSFIRDAFGMFGYAYDLSGAMYVIVESIFSGIKKPFYWIAVKSEQPHECAVYKMKQETYEIGERRFKQSLTTIVLAERAGRWEYQKELEEI